VPASHAPAALNSNMRHLFCQFRAADMAAANNSFFPLLGQQLYLPIAEPYIHGVGGADLPSALFDTRRSNPSPPALMSQRSRQ
jgi:hypothetical protein